MEIQCGHIRAHKKSPGAVRGHALLWKIGFVGFIKVILYSAVEKHSTFSFHVFWIGKRVLITSNAVVNPSLSKSTVGLLLSRTAEFWQSF